MMIAGDMIGEILTSVVVLTKLDVDLSLSLVVHTECQYVHV